MALFNLIDHVYMLLKKLRFWVLSSVIDYYFDKDITCYEFTDIDTEIFCLIELPPSQVSQGGADYFL